MELAAIHFPSTMLGEICPRCGAPRAWDGWQRCLCGYEFNPKAPDAPRADAEGTTVPTVAIPRRKKPEKPVLVKPPVQNLHLPPELRHPQTLQEWEKHIRRTCRDHFSADALSEKLAKLQSVSCPWFFVTGIFLLALELITFVLFHLLPAPELDLVLFTPLWLILAFANVFTADLQDRRIRGICIGLLLLGLPLLWHAGKLAAILLIWHVNGFAP